MSQSVLSQIEDCFSRLSISEQLLLIERLVHHVHKSTLKQTSNLDNQLALMAADPEIQNELERIEQEFAYTEADGLESGQ
jgi:hypothetical protein